MVEGVQSVMSDKAVFIGHDDEVLSSKPIPAAVQRLRQGGYQVLALPDDLRGTAGARSLELSASWLVGRSWAEVSAGRAVGCRTIVLADPEGAWRRYADEVDHVSSTLDEAAEVILSATATEPAPKPDPPADGGETVRRDLVLERLDTVIDLLRRQHRAAMRADFSIAKLLGAVAQMIALGLLLWTWVAIMESRYDAATACGLSAVTVQLIALTAFVVHRRE